jgi:uncharacterized membrane protein
MIGAEWIYWLCGFFFFVVGVQIAFDREHPKRWATSAFWCLFGAALCAGSFITGPGAASALLGAVVIVMALIAGIGLTGRGIVQTTTAAEREASAARLRNLLFVPALTIPAVTVIVALGGGRLVIGGRPLLVPGSQTLVGLGVATVAALAVGWIVLRPKTPGVAFVEGRRLLESVGWAALLPQMLSTLGLLFTQAGVGTQVGAIVQHVVPEHSRILAVLAYALGMVVFTMIMGNAFAAFPIMTAAVGWPILVQQMGAHPAPMFAIGMLAGFCGTLCTPMAANFNLVPPALLEMRDRYGQIKTQVPTAIALLAVNVCFMLIFPFL